MSFLVAVLVVTWLAIVVLTLALAGLTRQVRDLAAAVRSRGRSPLAPQLDAIPSLRSTDGTSRTVLLVIDDVCTTCRLVAPEFAILARHVTGQEFRVLTYTEGARAGLDGADIVVDVDEDTYRQLNLPWRPALVLVDADGTVLEAKPVGSIESLRRTVVAYTRKYQRPPAVDDGRHTAKDGAP